MANEKSIHCIVLDASPLLLNQPSISSLVATAEELYSVPAVIDEIRDPNARSRLETTILPFLKIRHPGPASVQHVSEFARKTGDYAVLSGPDLHVMALAYELECERNHGDWRLRNSPGQKELNGSPPDTLKAATDDKVTPDSTKTAESTPASGNEAGDRPCESDRPLPSDGNTEHDSRVISRTPSISSNMNEASNDADVLRTEVQPRAIKETSVEEDRPAWSADKDDDKVKSGSDDEGWITPSNLKKHQREAEGARTTASKAPSKWQVATITTDYALQNTLLLMNLNLLSSSLARISHLKSHVLRCHACFATTKQMDKQFCAQCGKPTLTRVTCTTSANGEFKLHLKKNMQWNNRGNRYSVPKPTPGSSSGKLGKGGRGQGGKGGWGKELVLTEDQKEYTRAVAAQKREQAKDLMDEDYLPNILSGMRSSTSRIKIGVGRDINSRRRQ